MRADAAKTVRDRAGMGATRTPDLADKTDKPLAEMTVAELDRMVRQYQMELNVLRATDCELLELTTSPDIGRVPV